jgi:FdhD protein
LAEGTSHAAGSPRPLVDIAVEEPLEIRVAGDTLAITMRTPGEDTQLALGFLLAEGIIRSRDDVGRVFHCGRPGEDGYGNTIDVAPGPGVALDIEHTPQLRRGTLVSSACGVCGRRTIEDLLARCVPLPSRALVPLDVLTSSPATLRAHQPQFARSGGTHAAAVLDARGALLAAHEDVGRHNAVDKALGALVLSGTLPFHARESRELASLPSVLVVSGRASFEIVQKAAVAGVAIICSVSAPTSLAIDLAERCGIALAAFVRDGKLTLYTHEERIAP